MTDDVPTMNEQILLWKTIVHAFLVQHVGHINDNKITLKIQPDITDAGRVLTRTS